MSDIVERMKCYIPGEAAHEDATPEVLELAIAEIERLRAERDHWQSLVSRADLVLFPFFYSPPYPSDKGTP